MRGSHLDIMDSKLNQSLLKRSHGSNKVTDLTFVTPVEYLIPNTDVLYFSLRVEGFDMSVNPLFSVVDVNESRDVAIGSTEGNRDAGVCKGGEDVWVAVVDLDAVYGGFGFKEVGYDGGWWEVVAEGAVVDTDGGGGWCRVEEEEEDGGDCREEHCAVICCVGFW